jgi:hypothetical protein
MRSSRSTEPAPNSHVRTEGIPAQIDRCAVDEARSSRDAHRVAVAHAPGVAVSAAPEAAKDLFEELLAGLRWTPPSGRYGLRQLSCAQRFGLGDPQIAGKPRMGARLYRTLTLLSPMTGTDLGIGRGETSATVDLRMGHRSLCVLAGSRDEGVCPHGRFATEFVDHAPISHVPAPDHRGWQSIYAAVAVFRTVAIKQIGLRIP